MTIRDIHFIREIMVNDLGADVPTLQVSYSNASSLNPSYKTPAFYEVDEVRALYAQLGGGRLAGARNGTTVVIPNRSRWANLWRITAEEVQVLEGGEAARD